MNKLKILEDLNKIETRLSQSHEPSIEVDLETFQFRVVNSTIPRVYKPLPTFEKVHRCNDLVRCVQGPFGSGKSSGSCAEILFRAIKMPLCKDGRRRCKCAIIRNTSGELETTSLQIWLEWFKHLGEVGSRKKPVIEYNYEFRVKGIKGIIELDLIFLALDDLDTLIEKLKSFPITFAYLNELSELSHGLLPPIIGRIGRYPSLDFLNDDVDPDDPYWSGIICDTNPPEVDSWLYKLFEEQRPEGYTLFRQPPGLLEVDEGNYITNPNAENLKNLKKDYYINMTRGKNKEFIKVYCMGEYGIVIQGKKIFDNYNDDLHAKESIQPDKDSTLILGWDFGLTPACLIAQLTDSGRIVVLKEFCTESSCVRDLAVDLVLPYLSSKYKDYSYISVGDPSDRPSDSTKQSCMQILNECGIHTNKAITNDIISRIDAVNQYLSKLMDGHPAIIISKEDCPVLRKGFLGRYNYRRLRVIGEEKYRDIPDKTHPYSDIQDCLQYICLEFSNKSKQNRTLDKDFFKITPAWC